MRGTTLIAVEGVLAQVKLGERLVESHPLPRALGLYETLRASDRIMLSTTAPPEDVQHWLRVNGFKDWGSVFAENYLFPEEHALRQHHRTIGRNEGVALYLTADPEDAAQALYEGFTTLVYCHPQFGRPEWRPDVEVAIKPWDLLTTEIDRQRLLASQPEVEDA